jgi:hypothetical protein
MVRSLTFAVATVAAAAVLSAQTPSPAAPAQPGGQPPAVQQPTPPTSSPGASASTSASGDKVTWSGCLKPGTTAGTWILDSAEMPALATGAGGTAVGTSGASASKRAFNLSPKSGDNLTPHANHKIEVTGTVTPANTMPSTETAAADAPSAGAARPTLKIDSFKMVSATCQ